MWICDYCRETNDSKATECAHCGPQQKAEKSLWHPAQSPEPAIIPARDVPYIPAGSETDTLYRSSLHDTPTSYKPMHGDDPEPSMPMFGDEPPPYLPIRADMNVPYVSAQGAETAPFAPYLGNELAPYESVSYHAEKQISRFVRAFRLFIIAPLIIGCPLYFIYQAIRSQQVANRYHSECSEAGRGISSGLVSPGPCSHVDRP